MSLNLVRLLILNILVLMIHSGTLYAEINKKEIRHPGTLLTIFPLPAPNTIGTLNLNKSLTALKLNSDYLNATTIKKKYLKQIAGGNLYFLQHPSDRDLVYLQTRRLVWFRFKGFGNLRHPELKIYRPYHSFDQNLEWGMAVDIEKGLFLLGVLDTGISGFPYFLKLYELKNGESKEIKSYQIKKSIWSAHEKGIIVYDGSFHCMNLFLNETDHPLCNPKNKIKFNLNRVQKITLHPVLPFMIVKGTDRNGKDTSSFVRWNKEGEISIKSSFLLDQDGEELVPQEIYFSPDGKKMAWSFFTYRKHHTDSNNYVLFKDQVRIMMSELEEKEDFYLGKTDELIELVADPFSAVWTFDSKHFIIPDIEGKKTILHVWTP